MRVHVLALDHVFDLGLSAVLDAFQTANELIGVAGLAVPRFEVRTVGLRRSVKTSQGLQVPVQKIGGQVPDCVVVPAIGFKMPGPLQTALARPEVRDAAPVLRDWAARGAMMTAACIGTFVMAESGLLDGHRATTTWWLAPVFRERYPKVALEESQMVVGSGRFVTAGAALGHIDLALWLVRRTSPQLASLTAKYLIVDSRASQSAYALTDHLVHSDPIVQRFERWARARLHLRGPAGDARDGFDRLAEEVAVVEARAAAERAHRLAQLGLDERVDHNGSAALHPVDRELEVFLRLDPWMADLDELLVRELRLERLDEPRRRFARGVGHDVQLDRRVRHAGSVSRALLSSHPKPPPTHGAMDASASIGSRPSQLPG